MFFSYAFVIYRTQYLLVFHFPFLLIIKFELDGGF